MAAITQNAMRMESESLELSLSNPFLTKKQ